MSYKEFDCAYEGYLVKIGAKKDSDTKLDFSDLKRLEEEWSQHQQ
jgi:hypothetical protein